jgi:hypothetical protein
MLRCRAIRGKLRRRRDQRPTVIEKCAVFARYLRGVPLGVNATRPGKAAVLPDGRFLGILTRRRQSGSSMSCAISLTSRSTE